MRRPAVHPPTPDTGVFVTIINNVSHRETLPSNMYLALKMGIKLQSLSLANTKEKSKNRLFLKLVKV
jgi:hypothetical protein